MSEWIPQLIQFLPHGASYLLLILLIALLESLPLVGLALPGSTLIVLSGFLAAHGQGNIWLIVLCSGCGALIGDSLSFLLGLKFGARILNWPFMLRQQSATNAAKQFLHEHGGMSLLYARFLGPIRGTIPFLAGLSNIPVGRFTRTTILASLLWGLTYPGLGYLGGESWKQAESLSSRFGLLIFLALGASLFHLWLKRKAK